MRASRDHDVVVSASHIDKTSATPVELKWQIWLPWLALASILLTATRTDPDFWGHVRFGLDWLRTRTLPSIDPYSFTQDKPWVNHEWLSEAAMGAAFALVGDRRAWSCSKQRS